MYHTCFRLAAGFYGRRRGTQVNAITVHCEHVLTVQLADPTDHNMTVQGVINNDSNPNVNNYDDATAFAQGKTISFGGSKTHLFDITGTVEIITHDKNNTSVAEQKLRLIFTNHGWKKATLRLPYALMIGRATDVKTTAAE